MRLVWLFPHKLPANDLFHMFCFLLLKPIWLFLEFNLQNSILFHLDHEKNNGAISCEEV